MYISSSTEINTYPSSSLQIGRIIETSVVSLTLLKENQIVGFGAFDHPDNLEELIKSNNLDPGDFTSRTILSFTVLVLSRREDIPNLVRTLFTNLFDSGNTRLY